MCDDYEEDWKMQETLRDARTALYNTIVLLGEVAPKEPIQNRRGGCVWCGAYPSDLKYHGPNCRWRKAREAIAAYWESEDSEDWAYFKPKKE